MRTGRDTDLLPKLQEPARILAADDELIVMEMDDKRNEFLTPETVGEMYVRWRLEEGLFSNETLGTVRYVVDHSEERELQADAFAREVGQLMMPYLSSHPDVGFNAFRKSVRNMIRKGEVHSYCERLTDEYPHHQIIEAINNACESVGCKYHEDMLIYVKLGKGQKIHMIQYKNLNLHIIVHHGVKRHNLCIAFDTDIKAEPKEDEGVVYVWL